MEPSPTGRRPWGLPAVAALSLLPPAAAILTNAAFGAPFMDGLFGVNRSNAQQRDITDFTSVVLVAWLLSIPFLGARYWHTRRGDAGGSEMLPAGGRALGLGLAAAFGVAWMAGCTLVLGVFWWLIALPISEARW